MEVQVVLVVTTSHLRPNDLLLCWSKAACAGGMFSMLCDMCENRVIHVVFTCISSLARQYIHIVNISLGIKSLYFPSKVHIVSEIYKVM